jgi:hypothetical protein
MEYRALGDTGYEVSPLGFGSMRLPMVDIAGVQYVDIEKAVEVIQTAFEQGVNYIDSGFMYCNQESEYAVGRALRGWRDKVIVTTKATKQRMEKPGDLRRLLEHQLVKLDTDYLDFYLFHGIGWDNFHAFDEKTGWKDDMLQAKEEGLIKHIGFSFHDDPQRMVDLVDLGFFDLVTCQYNYLDQRNEESIAYAADQGLGVIVMGPVGGGRLSVIPKGGGELFDLDEEGAAGLALRFVLANPNVHVALSGMGTVEMVKQNVSAVEAGPLDEEEVAALSALMEKNRALADLYCTGCEYCMPCPNGVNIPRNFELYNYYRVYGFENYALEQYARLVAREQDASVCVECGTCLDECPQEIPIIEQLKEVARLLD